ncbi:MAG: peptidyl-tRNA hydrolase [Candidatus Aenigmarchaeota archaeon]|nr:peptidyl-tRNA hydrolase [Candidatus Aenigmarchaeota archaeon]
MYKQVIILRKDLHAGKGKIIAHAVHAAIGAMRKVDDEIIEKWESEGSKKVVLKVRDLKELKDVEGNLKKSKIPYFLVKDAGLTQLKAGTITALGIGPIEEKKVDKVTGKLRLL